jgi:hypothetical protein
LTYLEAGTFKLKQFRNVGSRIMGIPEHRLSHKNMDIARKHENDIVMIDQQRPPMTVVKKPTKAE